MTHQSSPDRVDGRDRFGFGDNWARFLSVLDEERIEVAKRSLREWTGLDSFRGLSFLDIGSGSGLFSLAARQLGATVHSFDYDPASVACTQELRRRYFDRDPAWTVERGSALDADYLATLGTFDVVYSWGVLHHTGDMQRALANAATAVKPGGLLFIAIYNDQGRRSQIWRGIKRGYNRLPQPLRPAYVAAIVTPINLRVFLMNCLRGHPLRYLQHIRDYARSSLRGMSWWHDQVDWVGGLPFEVAKPEEIFDFYRQRGFVLERLETCAGLGCNQFVLRRETPTRSTTAAAERRRSTETADIL